MKPVRIAGAFVALVFLAGSVVLTLARLLDSESEAWVLAASFVPWALVGYSVALVLFALVLWRQPWGKVRMSLIGALFLCAVGLGLHAWWLAPSYLGEHAPGQPNLTVLEFNMLKGRADPGDTAAMIRRSRPDLMVLTEVTPEALVELQDEGVVGPGSPLPHLAGEALPGASGVLVASRSPLSVERTLALTHPAYVVRVEAAKPYDVFAVHTAQPAIDFDAWREDHAILVREERRMQGPHLVVGDLNATLDHHSIREMMGDGMNDAAQVANSGWQPTWPSPEKVRVKGIPTPFGLFAIDHVLMSAEFSASSTSAPAVRDSDHRALVARLVRR